MERLGRTKRDEIAGVSVSLRTFVSKIDIHFRDEIVFLLRGRRKEKLLVDAYSLRRLAIELNAPISATAERKLRERRRSRLLDDGANRRVIRRIQDNALAVFDGMVKQDGFANSPSP